MNTKNEPSKDKPTDKTKLVEYQVCQQETKDKGSSFWTLASIFIGFSTVLLGGGLISNNVLLDDFTHTSILNAPGSIFTLRIMATFACIAMIISSVFPGMGAE